MSAINTSPEESSLQAPRDIGVAQGEVDDSHAGPGAMPQPSASINDDIWLLNDYSSVGGGGQNFFITYISRTNSWHRVNVLVRRSRDTDSIRQIIDTKIVTATAASPEDGSQMIYGYVRGLIQDATLGNIITKLVISNDGPGKLDIRFSSDKKELARLSRLNNPPITWQVLVVKEVMYIRQTGLWTYNVHCELKQYTFQQTPDREMLEDFICPHMSNLAYVVMDEPEEIICGYLVDEHPLQESLYSVLRRANENRVPLPWDARRRWAIQLVSAVHSLHAAGFVHGALTLNTVFLVPGSSQPAENLPDIVATHTILVSCPTITSRAPWPDIYSSPELLIRHVNKPPRFCLSTQSDLYALGVILWALAVQDCEPALYRRNWSRLAFPITHAFEPGTTWRFPVRDAIRDCLNTQPQNRPTTDFLLQVLKEDAPTEIRTEPQADDFDTPVSRHEVHEQRQAEAALTRDLQALLEDYGLSKRTDDILLDTLDVEPAYEGLTLEERKLARWEHSDRSAASMAHTLTMSQAAGVEIEMDEEV